MGRRNQKKSAIKKEEGREFEYYLEKGTVEELCGNAISISL